MLTFDDNKTKFDVLLIIAREDVDIKCNKLTEIQVYFKKIRIYVVGIRLNWLGWTFKFINFFIVI